MRHCTVSGFGREKPVSRCAFPSLVTRPEIICTVPFTQLDGAKRSVKKEGSKILFTVGLLAAEVKADDNILYRVSLKRSYFTISLDVFFLIYLQCSNSYICIFMCLEWAHAV